MRGLADRIGTETGELLPGNSITRINRTGVRSFPDLLLRFRLHPCKRGRPQLQSQGKNQGFPVLVIPTQSALLLLILISSSGTIMYSRFG